MSFLPPDESLSAEKAVPVSREPRPARKPAPQGTPAPPKRAPEPGAVDEAKGAPSSSGPGAAGKKAAPEQSAEKPGQSKPAQGKGAEAQAAKKADGAKTPQAKAAGGAKAKTAEQGGSAKAGGAVTPQAEKAKVEAARPEDRPLPQMSKHTYSRMPSFPKEPREVVEGDGVFLVDGRGLEPVGVRPTMKQYLAGLWRRRHFILIEARGRSLYAHEDTVLGRVWMVLAPVLNGLIYAAIFGFILGTRRGIENFAAYVIVGVFLYQFFSACLSQGSKAVSSGQAMIRAFVFPRAALVVSVVARQLVTLVPVLAAMLVLILLVPDGNPGWSPPEIHVSWAWLMFPLVLVPFVALCTGIAFIAARLTSQFPDFGQVVQFIARVMFYLSGVFWSLDRFVDGPMLKVLEANPIYQSLHMSRQVLLYAQVPSLGQWAWLVLMSLVLLVAGFVFFWQAEERYARQR